MMIKAIPAGLLVLAAWAVSPKVTEWEVPWPETRPRDPYVDASGQVWFVGQVGNYIARLDPKTGEFKRFEIDEGTHPHNLVVATDGKVWFTGNRNGRLVRMDPTTGALTNIMIPEGVQDPHTMIFDRGGNAWFTAQQAGAVGRLDAKSGQVRLWRTGANTRPYGIVIDGRGRAWFDLFGTNKLGMIDSTMAVREFPLPNAGTRPRRIGVTGDGSVWYTDYPRGYLGRLDPSTGSVEEFALPGAQRSLPYAMAVDGQGRIWVSETGVAPNRLVAFDPKRRVFSDTVETEGGSEPNTIRHMVYDRGTKAIWYGTDRNTIGRLPLD
jgi:virginiamycin B lyase